MLRILSKNSKENVSQHFSNMLPRSMYLEFSQWSDHMLQKISKKNSEVNVYIIFLACYPEHRLNIASEIQSVEWLYNKTIVDYWVTVCLFVWFGLKIAFNNLSVISQRCLDVAGSSMLTFRVLPHWNHAKTLWHDIPPSHIILTLSWPVLTLLS